MKIILISALLIINLTNVLAQNITLDELISLRKKNLVNVEEYLSSKKWNYLRAENPTPENLGKVVFSYDKNNFNDEAQSFINYYYSEETNRKRIGIQLTKTEKYNDFITKIKSFGCKVIDSRIEENQIVKVYQGSTITFEVRVTTQKNDFNSTNTSYLVFIFENDDYNINFGQTTFTLINETEINETEKLSDFEIADKEYNSNKQQELNLTKHFFIGKWIDENSVFIFAENGDFILKYNHGKEVYTKWKFIDNLLYIGLGENNEMILFNIIEYYVNYFNYSIEDNAKNYKAYKIQSNKKK